MNKIQEKNAESEKDPNHTDSISSVLQLQMLKCAQLVNRRTSNSTLLTCVTALMLNLKRKITINHRSFQYSLRFELKFCHLGKHLFSFNLSFDCGLTWRIMLIYCHSFPLDFFLCSHFRPFTQFSFWTNKTVKS